MTGILKRLHLMRGKKEYNELISQLGTMTSKQGTMLLGIAKYIPIIRNIGRTNITVDITYNRKGKLPFGFHTKQIERKGYAQPS